MRVAVDNTVLGTTNVTASSWTDYSASANIPAGSHVVSITYTNDYRSLLCDRNLLVDKVTIAPSTTATSTTATTRRVVR